MKQILIFPKGTLEPKDRERLSKAGCIAIEAEDPSKVVMLVPGAPLVTADDLLMAAMKGVMTPIHPKSAMADELYRRMKEKNPTPASNAEGNTDYTNGGSSIESARE